MRTFTFTGNSVKYMARKYCSEDISLIENYAEAKADNFKGWCIHHRLEYLPCQNRWVSKRELIEKGLYFNRPAWELVFMRRGDHNKLHNLDPKWKINTIKAIRNSEKIKDAVRQNIKKAQEAHRKPFEIDGIRFERIDDAAKYFKVGAGSIHRWLHNPDKYKKHHTCKYI